MGGERKTICACLHDLVVLWFLNIPMHLCLVLYENLQNTDVWEMNVFFSNLRGVYGRHLSIFVFMLKVYPIEQTLYLLEWL